MTFDMRQDDPLGPFWAIAKRAVGKECWSALVVVGSIIDLDLGGRVPLHMPIENPKRLRPDQARFRGEFNLELGYAHWILLHGATKTCDSDDPPPKIHVAVTALEGKRINAIGREVAQFLDVKLWFSTGMVFEFSERYVLAVDLENDLEDGDDLIKGSDSDTCVTVVRRGTENVCTVGIE